MRTQGNRSLMGNGLPVTNTNATGVNSLQDEQQASQGGTWPGTGVVPSTITTSFDWLVVGGGGSGGKGVSQGPGTGFYSRGGGGAGGYQSGSFTNNYLGGTTWSVSIGGGGVSSLTGSSPGGVSTLSCPVFGGQVLALGGGSLDQFQSNQPTGSWYGIPTTPNGSGGGSDYVVMSGGGSPGQGNSGGIGPANSNQAGSGGGGAGGGGGAAIAISISSSQGAGGGPGTTWLNGITYAGGGGGGTKGPTGGGGGGAGGGGTGGQQATPATPGGDGSANTGGGGGGSARPSGIGGGTGGSGVVIIRWPDTFSQATSTTGSPTYVQSGGYHYYTFTGNGSFTI